eukprot:475713_1
METLINILSIISSLFYCTLAANTTHPTSREHDNNNPRPVNDDENNINQADVSGSLGIIFAIIFIPICIIIILFMVIIIWCMRKRKAKKKAMTDRQQKSVQLPTQFNANNPSMQPGASHNTQNDINEFEYKAVAPSAPMASDHDINENVNKNNGTFTDEGENEGVNQFEWIKQWFINDIEINESDKMQYLDLFIENGFENKISVKQLDKQQLNEMGIVKLGHINIILSAAKHI